MNPVISRTAKFTLKPQNFAIIYHDHRPPILIVTLLCASLIIEEPAENDLLSVTTDLFHREE